MTALAVVAGIGYGGYRLGRDAGEASMMRLSDRMFWARMDAGMREQWKATIEGRALRRRLEVVSSESEQLRGRLVGVTSLSRVVAEQLLGAVTRVSATEARLLLRWSALLEDLADAGEVANITR